MGLWFCGTVFNRGYDSCGTVFKRWGLLHGTDCVRLRSSSYIAIYVLMCRGSQCEEASYDCVEQSSCNINTTLIPRPYKPSIALIKIRNPPLNPKIYQLAKWPLIPSWTATKWSAFITAPRAKKPTLSGFGTLDSIKTFAFQFGLWPPSNQLARDLESLIGSTQPWSVGGQNNDSSDIS